jgi:GNAT superfamily N-acetyltransferase
MGMQDKVNVTLIRHAYVAPEVQRRGIGTLLLSHLRGLTRQPMLIGTWAAASWAIAFYEKHGFSVVPKSETLSLLKRYWSIPAKQAAASVVLSERRK